MEIKVLDHGYVKLIDSMGTEETIIEAARMSTGKGFQGWEKDQRLLEYLYKNKHMTPFEMCELTIEVKLPIMVVWEWVRHRTLSYNIESGRYTQLQNEHYVPDPSRIQKQSKSNNQGSAEEFPLEEAEAIIASLKQDQEMNYELYDTLVENGVAREISRLNAPMSRYTKMRVKGNLRNWLQFLMLRMHHAAQWEIRQFADAVASIIKEKWPRTYQLFLDHDFYAAHLSREEASWLYGHFFFCADSGEIINTMPKDLLRKLQWSDDG